MILTIGIPARNNPMNDGTGQKCATGQNSSSPIFYLKNRIM
jgi:hypothetical protein